MKKLFYIVILIPCLLIGQSSVNDANILTKQIELLIDSGDIDQKDIVHFIIHKLWKSDSIYIESSVDLEMEKATHRADICDVSYQYHKEVITKYYNIAISLANEKQKLRIVESHNAWEEYEDMRRKESYEAYTNLSGYYDNAISDYFTNNKPLLINRIHQLLSVIKWLSLNQNHNE